jgi:NAD(P)-dependent dehydrogenase (short-subunit alcohol dehydrogenase family)
MNMGRLSNKVALVIGAGGSSLGLSNGKAVAVLFAREGARVIAVDINGEALKETCTTILEEGGQCETVVADATSSAEVASAVKAAVARCGRIDILHNNVGRPIMGDPVALSDADWQHAIEVNLGSAFLACKHVLPIMLNQGAGAVVNVSSLASIQVNAYPYFAYVAAKAGLNQFTRALAVHYGPHGIRANAVLPGVMDTPLIYREIAGQHASTEELRAKRDAASPMGRMGDAWDVAYAALFLASDEAKYITGVCLPVDGGKACWGR